MVKKKEFISVTFGIAIERILLELLKNFIEGDTRILPILLFFWKERILAFFTAGMV